MRWIVLAMALTLAFSGCTDKSSPPDDKPPGSDPPDDGNQTTPPAPPVMRGPETFTVVMADIEFKDGTLTILQGDTVSWVHEDGAIVHRVETGQAPVEFDSGDMTGSSNSVFNFTFETPGTYDYFCRYHGSMVANITVEPREPVNETPPETNATGEQRGPVTWDISIEGVAFKDGSITIQVGDTVKWTHRDGTTPHTVTADQGEFDSGAVYMTQYANAEFEHTFDDVGEFGYFCEVHPGMTGTITVLERFDGVP